jgi:hypothetical protein
MSGDRTRTQALVQKPDPGGIRVSLFIAFVPIHLLVVEEISVAIAALTLVLIGVAYIGFGASARSMTIFWFELGGAILYAFVAVALLLWKQLAFLLGHAAHDVWDFLHHKGAFGAPVPKWCIPFCVGFDLHAATILPRSLSPVRCIQ